MNFYLSESIIANRYEVVQGPAEKRSLAGGMGLVYLCMDRQEDRPVALKTFRPEFLPDRAARDRFLREGTTWVDLGRHPNIVRCYNVDRVGDGREVYLSLELVAGEQGKREASLRSWLTPGQPLDVEQALLFALQVARGMGYACEQIPGFVHRDLKPENLLVGADRLASLGTNRLRVTDFGLANILQDFDVEILPNLAKPSSGNGGSRSALSRTQLTRGIIGTPLYMAPEQWQGGQLGAYTDIYALGCILVEILTGQFAVTGDSQGALQQAHCAGEVWGLPASLPAVVRELVDKCLAVDPSTRYQGWDALIVALGDVWNEITGRSFPASEAIQEPEREERIAVGWSYSNIGISYLDIGKADRARVYFEKSQTTGQAEGERHLELAGFGNLGIAYLQLGNAQRAIGYNEQALTIAREIGDLRGEGSVLGNLGNIYLRLGNARRAIGYYEKRLKIGRKVGDRRGEGNALGSLGSAYLQLGDGQRAIAYYEQALVIDREIGDRIGEGTALGNLGSAYFQLRDSKRAIGYYEQQLDISREIGDRIGEGNALGGVGTAYANLGDVRQALGYFEQWLEIAREIGDRIGEGTALGNMGISYKVLGNAQRAIDSYEQALAIHREIGDRMGVARTSFNIAMLQHQVGDEHKALSLATEAVHIWSQIGHTEYAQRAQQLIAMIRGVDAATSPASIKAAFEAFQRSDSLQEMQVTVAQYTLMTEDDFIVAIERIIAEQVPPEHKPAFQQRLAWLRQIAGR